jgi:DNA-binding XRE family transcriptional regulator
LETKLTESIWSAWAKGGTVRIRRIPIIDVLDKVPGSTWAEKGKRIGVARQVVWMWATGRTRPSWRNCERLERITGIKAEDIYGRVVHAK